MLAGHIFGHAESFYFNTITKILRDLSYHAA